MSGPSSPRERRLAAEALLTLIALGGSATAGELGGILFDGRGREYRAEGARRILRALGKAGLVNAIGRPSHSITEPGRVAAALAMAADPALRAAFFDE